MQEIIYCLGERNAMLCLCGQKIGFKQAASPRVWATPLAVPFSAFQWPEFWPLALSESARSAAWSAAFQWPEFGR